MARLLTAAALCVAIFIPRLAAQKQVQVATAVAYSNLSCTGRAQTGHWPVNLCQPYPVMMSNNAHGWGSMIYEVDKDLLVERKFQSSDCSGPQFSQNQLGPMVGGTGSCVPVAGPGDSIYAKSFTLTASSNSSWTYQSTFSDQGCGTPYGVYMLGNYLSSGCNMVPAGAEMPPAIPNTTRAYTQICDSSNNYTVCVYDSTNCSGQPTTCVPASAVSETCSSRPSNWNSFYVYKGEEICPGKVPAPTPAPTPGPAPAPLTCLDVKRMYQTQKCCETSKASQVFQWSVASAGSTDANAGSTDAKAGRRLADMNDKIRGLLSMVKAEEGEESARQLAVQLVKVVEPFTAD